MVADFQKLAAEVGEHLQSVGLKLVTAESCTGGMLSAAITEVPGSSNWFERGFVTYSNEAKKELLGVQTIDAFGAVSEETVKAMAEGALKNSQADIVIAITGIAGPSGGTAEKPVGTVWFAFGDSKKIQTACQCFKGDRQSIREQAVWFGLGCARA